MFVSKGVGADVDGVLREIEAALQEDEDREARVRSADESGE